MRKLLLASAAAFGATLAASATAQAQPLKPVAAGTLVVRVKGYLQFGLVDYGSSYNTINSPVGAYKLNPVTTAANLRIYPGFDGQSISGISYGVATDIRTQKTDAAQGITSSAVNVAGSTGLYIKRAYGYVGTPEAGYIRIGETDSAFTLLQQGVMEAYGDGNQFDSTDGVVNAALPQSAVPGNFVYADVGQLYATDKVVYITPAFAGLSASAGYEPNSNGIQEGYANNKYASSTSAALSSSPNASDIGSRRKNTVDVAVQYVLKYNGASIKTSAGYLYGAPIDYTGPGANLPGTAPYGYDNLSVYQLGAQVTYLGVTLAANVKGGAVEDSYTFKPKGGRDGFTYIVGANYVIGPWVAGASFYDGQTSGAYAPATFVPHSKTIRTIARTLSEYGVGIGGNYVISPNLALYVQYLYGHRHQPGATNSITYTSGSTTGTVKVAASAQVQAIGVGATFKW
jgi:hypothetical protein